MPRVSYLGAPFTTGNVVAIVFVMPTGVKRLIEFTEIDLGDLKRKVEVLDTDRPNNLVLIQVAWQGETYSTWLGAYKATDRWRFIISDVKPEPNWWLAGEAA